MSSHDVIGVLAELERFGFADLLLWLLSFAILFGILSQVKIPESKVARALISVAVAFLVILAAPAGLVSIFSSLSTGLVLVVLAILVFIVFLEAGGIKEQHINLKTGKMEEHNIFKKHAKEIGLIIIIIAILVFVGAGGLNILGISANLGSAPTMTLLFFVVIILAVFWLIFEKGEK